jgi:hypothetical protein
VRIKKVLESKDFLDLESDVAVLMDDVVTKFGLNLVMKYNEDDDDTDEYDDFDWYSCPRKSYLIHVAPQAYIKYEFKVPLIGSTIKKEDVETTIEDLKFAEELLKELLKVMDRVPKMGYFCLPLTYYPSSNNYIRIMFALESFKKTRKVR